MRPLFDGVDAEMQCNGPPSPKHITAERHDAPRAVRMNSVFAGERQALPHRQIPSHRLPKPRSYYPRGTRRANSANHQVRVPFICRSANSSPIAMSPPSITSA